MKYEIKEQKPKVIGDVEGIEYLVDYETDKGDTLEHFQFVPTGVEATPIFETFLSKFNEHTVKVM